MDDMNDFVCVSPTLVVVCIDTVYCWLESVLLCSRAISVHGI